MKRILSIVLFTVLCLTPFFSEDLPRIAIVDDTAVYMEYYKESFEVRQIEDLQNQLKSETERLNQELEDLKTQITQAETEGRTALARELRTKYTDDYNHAIEYLDYLETNIESEKQQLANMDTFTQEFWNAIDYVCRDQGYSIVFKRSTEGLLWWNNTVDITDLVIENLRWRIRY